MDRRHQLCAPMRTKEGGGHSHTGLSRLPDGAGVGLAAGVANERGNITFGFVVDPPLHTSSLRCGQPLGGGGGDLIKNRQMQTRGNALHSQFGRGGGGGLPQRLSKCAASQSRAYAGFSYRNKGLQRLSQATGEVYLWGVTVGQSCLCSHVLLLPLGVPPTPAPAMHHIQAFPRL